MGFTKLTSPIQHLTKRRQCFRTNSTRVLPPTFSDTLRPQAVNMNNLKSQRVVPFLDEGLRPHVFPHDEVVERYPRVLGPRYEGGPLRRHAEARYIRRVQVGI